MPMIMGIWCLDLTSLKQHRLYQACMYLKTKHPHHTRYRKSIQLYPSQHQYMNIHEEKNGHEMKQHIHVEYAHDVDSEMVRMTDVPESHPSHIIPIESHTMLHPCDDDTYHEIWSHLMDPMKWTHYRVFAHPTESQDADDDSDEDMSHDPYRNTSMSMMSMVIV